MIANKSSTSLRYHNKFSLSAQKFSVKHATHLGKVHRHPGNFGESFPSASPTKTDIAKSIFSADGWSLSACTTSLKVFLSMEFRDAIPAGRHLADPARSILVSAESGLRRVFKTCCLELFNTLLFDFNDHWLVVNQIELNCCKLCCASRRQYVLARLSTRNDSFARW